MGSTMNDWVRRVSGVPAPAAPPQPPRPANANAGAGAGVPNVAPTDSSAAMNALIRKAMGRL
ncbi:MAG: hypothetical protein HZB26_07285 [Candidatus Hydrogenedentes bacterium]|nr:hypothetical protein [Candidatus Hydrogenedentota bacterium]